MVFVRTRVLCAVAGAALLAGCAVPGGGGRVDDTASRAGLSSRALVTKMSAVVSRYTATLDTWLSPQAGTTDDVLTEKMTAAVALDTLFRELRAARDSLEIPDGVQFVEVIPGSPLILEFRYNNDARCILPDNNADGYFFAIVDQPCSLGSDETYVYTWQLRFMDAAVTQNRDAARALMRENLGVYAHSAYVDLWYRAQRTSSVVGDVDAAALAEVEAQAGDRAVQVEIDTTARRVRAHIRGDVEFQMCLQLPDERPQTGENALPQTLGALTITPQCP